MVVREVADAVLGVTVGILAVIAAAIPFAGVALLMAYWPVITLSVIGAIWVSAIVASIAYLVWKSGINCLAK